MTNPYTDILDRLDITALLVRICTTPDEAKELSIDLSHAFPLNEFRIVTKVRSFNFRVEVIDPSPMIYDSICVFTDGWGKARRRYYQAR